MSYLKFDKEELVNLEYSLVSGEPGVLSGQGSARHQ